MDAADSRRLQLSLPCEEPGGGGRSHTKGLVLAEWSSDPNTFEMLSLEKIAASCVKMRRLLSL